MDARAALNANTRRRILEATRRLLAGRTNSDLGLDAVADAARISRVTIYNHFGSRAGLLEALYDYLAERGDVRRAKDALLQKDIEAVLARFIGALVDFWSSDAVAIRRLHAVAALDREIARGLAARDARRRAAAAEIVRRSASVAKPGRRSPAERLMADTLCALASFEIYDALARAGHGRNEIRTVITRLALAVVGHSARIRRPSRGQTSRVR